MMEIMTNSGVGKGELEMLNLNIMSNEQLEVLNKRTNNEIIARMSSEIKEMQNNLEKQKQELEDHEGQISEIENATNKIKDQINVIGYGLHSKKWGNFQKTCKRRVHELLGSMSDYNYLLWSHYFFKKIYSDVENHFEVCGCKNIHINDYLSAKAIASTWSPDEYYIRTKLQEMIEKRNKGTLPQNKYMALARYLEVTNDGEINPF